MRRVAAALLVAAAHLALAAVPASAHAGLRRAEPASDATLDAAPTAVRLSFSEEPEPSLSEVRLVDAGGTTYQAGPPQPAPDDPLSLVLPVKPLDQRVYTVTWRVVSRVDGHPTAGAYAFGVGVSPTAQATAAAARTESPSPSRVEIFARWLLAAGLVALLGAAVAAAAGFAGPPRAGRLAQAGWVASAAGLLLLADSQRRAAHTSLAALLQTPIGRALLWRAVAVAVAGVALLAARRGRLRLPAAWVTAGAAAAAMAVHVGAGHAAGGSSVQWPRVAAQWVHFAAVGVWVGGLAALLLGVRGEPSKAKAASVRRFSSVAAVTLGLVVLTGVARTFNELSAWSDLTSTGYGRAVLVKGGLLLAMVALAAVNRRRSVPAAATSLRPLRRASAGELVLGAGALAAAAVLATLTPPASLASEPTGITVTGADFATSVRARLTTQSARPGPNRFSVRAVDYDSGRPVRAERVSLRFDPLDDPGVAPTTLALEPAPDGSFTGSGSNLSLDGRWRVDVLLEARSGTVSVPLDVHLEGPPRFVSVERIPGRPVRTLVELSEGIYVRVHAEPERPGRNQVFAAFIDDFGEQRAVESLVLTTTTGRGPTRQRAVTRLGEGRFSAEVTLAAGRPTTVALVARSRDGTRWRATVDLVAPKP